MEKILGYMFHGALNQGWLLACIQHAKKRKNEEHWAKKEALHHNDGHLHLQKLLLIRAVSSGE